MRAGIVDLKRRIRAIQGESSPEAAVHDRIDAVLRMFAAEELGVLDTVLTRWHQAGHPDDSLPDPSQLEAGDTGLVVDGGTKTLIATEEEWEVFLRFRDRWAEAGGSAAG